MKGLDVSNSRLIKIVAMFLATTVVVGIVSSSAIRLVAATYYMQTKRKLTTNIPVVNQIIDAVVGDSNIAGPVTPEPDTTAPATGNASAAAIVAVMAVAGAAAVISKKRK